MIKFPYSPIVNYTLAKKVYMAIFIFSFLWLLLIFLAPLFEELGGVFKNISSFIYIFFSNVCHQNDTRSLHLFEHKLGVCSRCVLIYSGFFIGTCFYALKYRLNNTNIPSIWLLIVVSFMLLLDVFLNELEIMENTFLSRSVTGFILGFVLPFYLIPGFVKFFDEVYSFLRNKVNV